MTSFLNGPAAGQTLMLQRAPTFLRVVVKGKVWDALDQVSDTPAPGETIYAYRIQGEATRMHVHGQRSGWFTVASYVFVPEQPSAAALKNGPDWQEWCREEVKKPAPVVVVATTPAETIPMPAEDGQVWTWIDGPEDSEGVKTKKRVLYVPPTFPAREWVIVHLPTGNGVLHCGLKGGRLLRKEEKGAETRYRVLPGLLHATRMTADEAKGCMMAWNLSSQYQPKHQPE